MSSVDVKRLDGWRYVVLAVWLGHALLAMLALWWVGLDGALSQGIRYSLLGRVAGHFAPQVALLYACLFVVAPKKSSATGALDSTRVLIAAGVVVTCHLLTASWFFSDLYAIRSRLQGGGALLDGDSIDSTVNHYLTISGIVFAAFATAPLKYLFPRAR